MFYYTYKGKEVKCDSIDDLHKLLNNEETPVERQARLATAITAAVEEAKDTIAEAESAGVALRRRGRPLGSKNKRPAPKRIRDPKYKNAYRNRTFDYTTCDKVMRQLLVHPKPTVIGIQKTLGLKIGHFGPALRRIRNIIGHGKFDSLVKRERAGGKVHGYVIPNRVALKAAYDHAKAIASKQ